MKSNPNTNDIQEAMSRVEKAKSNKANASRRLARAQSAVEAANKDVSDADEELKLASANLDQTVRKSLSLAMKKGGTDLTIAMAEIIARSLGGGEGSSDDLGGQSTAQEPSPAPTPAPAKSSDPDAGAPSSDEGSNDGQPKQDDLLGAAE